MFKVLQLETQPNSFLKLLIQILVLMQNSLKISIGSIFDQIKLSIFLFFLIKETLFGHLESVMRMQ